MTREEAKQLLPIIEAYAEGGKIEFKEREGEWLSFGDMEFGFDKAPENYRIKPEPKSRSFNTIKECWFEMQKHQPFGWVKSKETGDFFSIDSLYILKRNQMRDHIVRMSYGQLYLCDMYKRFTFADGQTFGIKVEEAEQ